MEKILFSVLASLAAEVWGIRPLKTRVEGGRLFSLPAESDLKFSLTRNLVIHFIS